MYKRFPIALLALAFAVCGAGCGKTPTPAAAAESSSPAGAPIAASAQPATVEAPPVVSGPLIVEHQVDVAAQRDGVLAKIEAEPGMRVKAGAALAQLDDRQISADMEAARAKTRSIDADLKNWEAEAKVVEADYQRAQKLWEANIIPQEQLLHQKYKAESEQWEIVRERELLTNAQQNERSLELELEKTRIRAPFDGLVARRYVREGQQVVRGDRLFWVTAEAPLRMRVTLPERFLGRLKKGQTFPLTSPDVPDETHPARIIELSPVVDPSSGTIEVLLELSGPTGQLRPGMSASVHLENPR